MVEGEVKLVWSKAGKQARLIYIFIPLQNECFCGYTGISPSVCPGVRLCTYTSFCQSAGVGVKSHLVTAPDASGQCF